MSSSESSSEDGDVDRLHDWNSLHGSEVFEDAIGGLQSSSAYKSVDRIVEKSDHRVSVKPEPEPGEGDEGGEQPAASEEADTPAEERTESTSEEPPEEVPGGEPTEEPSTEEPAEAPPAEPEEPLLEGPAEAPAEEPAETPDDDTAEATAEEPAEAPSEEAAEQPAEAPAEEAAEEPSEAPAEETAEEPAEAPAEVSAEVPTEESAEAPAQESVDASAEEPAETTADDPDETPPEEQEEAPADAPPEEPEEAPADAPPEEPEEVPADAPPEEPQEVPEEPPPEEPADAPSEEPEEPPPEDADASPEESPEDTQSEEPVGETGESEQADQDEAGGEVMGRRESFMRSSAQALQDAVNVGRASLANVSAVIIENLPRAEEARTTGGLMLACLSPLSDVEPADLAQQLHEDAASAYAGLLSLLIVMLMTGRSRAMGCAVSMWLSGLAVIHVMVRTVLSDTAVGATLAYCSPPIVVASILSWATGVRGAHAAPLASLAAAWSSLAASRVFVRLSGENSKSRPLILVCGVVYCTLAALSVL